MMSVSQLREIPSYSYNNNRRPDRFYKIRMVDRGQKKAGRRIERRDLREIGIDEPERDPKVLGKKER